MYTTVEIIDKVREKLNKNSTNDNITFDNPRIVIAINEAQNKYLEWIIEKKNEDDLRFIQKFAIQEKPLIENKKSSENSQYFILPKDYFDFINLSLLAKKSTCRATIFTWEAKSYNTQELLSDEFNKPSFYYQDTFYTFGEDSIRVFTNKDFDIEKANLTYYRYPNRIDIEGYITIENKNSVNSNSEWDNKIMDKIIDIVVKDLNVNVENLQRFQVDNQKIISKY